MMEIVTLPRAGGKTQRILEWAAATPDGVVIVTHQDEARRLAEISGLPPDRFVPIGDVLGRLPDRRVFAIDNLDQILGLMFGPVDLVTVTDYV